LGAGINVSIGLGLICLHVAGNGFAVNGSKAIGQCGKVLKEGTVGFHITNFLKLNASYSRSEN
jgi:hypothetical protein